MSVVVVNASSAWSGGALDYGNQRDATITAASEWEGGALSYTDARASGIRQFPAELLTHEGAYTRRHGQAATASPSSLAVQVQDRGGRAWRLSLAWDGIDAARAEILAEFVAWVAAPGRMFVLSLDRFAPGVSPAPGDRVFVCAGAAPGWTSGGRVFYGARLEAVEIVGADVAASDVIRAGTAGWQGGALDYYLPEQFNIFPGSRRWEGANDAAA